jgi:hypothetical protein
MKRLTCRPLLAVVAAGCLLAGAQPSFAISRDFIARPTQPYECSSLVAARGASKVWRGFFHGRKEVDQGFFRYDDAFERPCFTDEQSCRNWLYNMQSEYRDMVWAAECRPGFPR